MTSTLRTAWCGPACQVVWQGPLCAPSSATDGRLVPRGACGRRTQNGNAGRRADRDLAGARGRGLSNAARRPPREGDLERHPSAARRRARQEAPSEREGDPSDDRRAATGLARAARPSADHTRFRRRLSELVSFREQLGHGFASLEACREACGPRLFESGADCR